MTLRLIRSEEEHDRRDAAPPHDRLPRVSIEMQNLLVSYDSTFALQCEDARITGNVTAVLGHNGAGKSTLLKAGLGLLPLQSGKITLTMARQGNVFKLHPEKHIAFCPESGSVFADISVESYIKLWCRIKHRNARYYLEEGSRYIELLNLGHLLGKLGRELSKGQRRRVQTAIGFFMKPELFLLDEPFDGLDVQKTHELTEIIEDHERNMSFMISSHRMDVIERLADTLVVLDRGRIFTHGGVDAVCTALAGKCVFVTLKERSEQAAAKMRDHFPNLLVNQIGNQIAITGEEISLPLIKEFLNSIEAAIHDLEQARPSLVDAMNYHLRKVALAPSA